MNGKELYDTCLNQENTLVFHHFTRDDALKLGLSLHHRNADYGNEAAIEITINGLVVFRYFPEGTSADNGLWLARKRRTVELMEMSSMRLARDERRDPRGPQARPQRLRGGRRRLPHPRGGYRRNRLDLRLRYAA